MSLHDLYSLLNPAVDECSGAWSTFDDDVNEAVASDNLVWIAKAIDKHPMATRLSREQERIVVCAQDGRYIRDTLDHLLYMALLVLARGAS